MLIHTDVFVNAIMVLLHRQSETVRAIISDFLDVCATELRSGIQMNDEHLRFYVNFLKDLLHTGYSLNDKAELESIILKIQSNGVTLQNREIHDTLLRIISSPGPMPEDRVSQILNGLKEEILWYQINKKCKQVWSQSAIFTNAVNYSEKNAAMDKMKNAISELYDVANNEIYGDVNKTGVVNKIDFSSKENLLQALTQFHRTNVQGILKFGLQGMNRMFGSPGGFNRTESIVFLALSHHYKSRMLMCTARWVAQYNDAPVDAKGIPTILFISLENEADANLMTLFKDAYASLMGRSAEGVPHEEIIEFVYEHFNARGWKLVVERRLGESFGFVELKSLIETYEKNGHQICVCIIDYMNLMKKTGNANHGNHLHLRELYSNIVNYLKHKECALITAHQLNRDAAKIASTGLTNVVQKFNMSFLADGTDPFREVDVVCYLYIEKTPTKVSYLTMKIDKHRYVDDTPEAHKTCAYRFSELGIMDDIHGRDASVRNIYADEYIPPTSASQQTIDIDSSALNGSDGSRAVDAPVTNVAPAISSPVVDF